MSQFLGLSQQKLVWNGAFLFYVFVVEALSLHAVIYNIKYE